MVGVGIGVRVRILVEVAVCVGVDVIVGLGNGVEEGVIVAVGGTVVDVGVCVSIVYAIEHDKVVEITLSSSAH